MGYYVTFAWDESRSHPANQITMPVANPGKRRDLLRVASSAYAAGAVLPHMASKAVFGFAVGASPPVGRSTEVEAPPDRAMAEVSLISS